MRESSTHNHRQDFDNNKQVDSQIMLTETTSYADDKKNPCCISKIKERKFEQGNQKSNTEHVAIIKCGSPCGKAKKFAMSGVTFEIIPGSRPAFPTLYGKSVRYPDSADSMSSRIGDPPDPPPKQSPVTC
jgi:hypothetical protein